MTNPVGKKNENRSNQIKFDPASHFCFLVLFCFRQMKFHGVLSFAAGPMPPLRIKDEAFSKTFLDWTIICAQVSIFCIQNEYRQTEFLCSTATNTTFKCNHCNQIISVSFEKGKNNTVFQGISASEVIPKVETPPLHFREFAIGPS